MDPIVAVYNVKLTVRAGVAIDVPTNDAVSEALEMALEDLIDEGRITADGSDHLVTVNVTSIERADN